MKVLPNNIDGFIANDFKKFKGILLFGNDSSLVSARSAALQQKLSGGSNSDNCVINFDYSQIAKDPSILLLELNSPSFFCRDKVITIAHTDKNINKALANILSNMDGNHFLIFKAGELAPSSQTRKFFEMSEKFASIACYHKEKSEIKSILLSKLRAEAVQAPSMEIMDYIIDNLGGEYLTIIAEIDKIIIFLKTTATISLEEIKNVVNKHAHSTEYNNLIKHIINDDHHRAEIEFEKMITSGINVVAIVRSIVHYFIKILRVRTLLDQGKTEAFAMSTLSPPIFYKHEADFKKGLKKYKVEALLRNIEQLTKLEKDCKTYNIDPKLIYNQYLIAQLIED